MDLTPGHHADPEGALPRRLVHVGGPLVRQPHEPGNRPAMWRSRAVLLEFVDHVGVGLAVEAEDDARLGDPP